jgi:hypothetical protein
MSLILHAGANPVSYEQLRAVQTPPGTDTHIPIPHHEIVELMRYTLGFHAHDIVEETHAITPDGARYFGLMSLRSTYGDYTDVVGLRNSHDKTFPIGVAFGSRVFICDNLAFIGDHVIRRKHTVKAKRELPYLLTDIVRPLQEQRMNQNEKIGCYQRMLLDNRMADHATLMMYRENVIGVQRIADVLEQWERPQHDWGGKTAWRLFNAATLALSGKVAERPVLTQQLHKVIDGVCETVH